MNEGTLTWSASDRYEPYVGRWSRLVARDFLDWLAPARDLRWADVGCGTGALSHTIAERCAPRALAGVDRSAAYLDGARTRLGHADWIAADACALPLDDARFDVAVSALVLNFVADPRAMLGEMARVVRPGGTVALYVWDYAHHMELMRWLWDTAAELDPAAAELDEGRRFTLCAPDPLFLAFARSGIDDVEVRPIDVPTVFRDFDDYWTPFLGGQGPAPGYVMSLDARRRTELRERLRRVLPAQADGSIPLMARAWAVKGRTN